MGEATGVPGQARRILLLLHRYAGLYMAVFLVVAGLTGSVLAFGVELNRWLVPPRQVALRAEPVLDPIALRDRAQRMVSEGAVNRILLEPPNPGEAFTVLVEPRLDPHRVDSSELTYQVLYLNPYTGEELGRESLEEGRFWPLTRKRILPLIIALHYRLAVPGSIGIWLFGVAALIWTFDCFIGAWLTFPVSTDRRPRPRGVNAKPSRTSWWGSWRPAWQVRWGSAAYRLNFDLHRAGGLWVWCMLFILAWSSVGLNLRQQVYDPVMNTVFRIPKEPSASQPGLNAPQAGPGMTWHDARQVGRALMAEQAHQRGFRVIREFILYYDPESGRFIYFATTDKDIGTHGGGASVSFDGTTGRLVRVSPPMKNHVGETLSGWLFALHMAHVGGLPYKVFLSGMGFMVALLSVTGVYLWWKKRKMGRIVRHQRRSQGGQAPATS